MELLKFSKGNLIGILFGIIGTFLSFFVLYFYKFSYFRINETLDLLKTQIPLISSLLNFNMIINLVILSVLLSFKKDNWAKGVFYYTFIIGLITLYFKWGTSF